MLGDYPKTSDGVDRRAFSWLSPASSKAAASPGGMLPPPPRSPLAPVARRTSGTALLPAPALSPAPAAEHIADGPAAERALAVLEPPAKAPAALSRIKMGEHTVVWQRGAQAPVHAVTAPDSGTPEPSSTRPALVDYPDTAARGSSPADVPSFDHSVGTASDIPSAAQSADATRSRSGGPPAWMVQHGSAGKTNPPARTAADSRLSSDEYPLTSDGDAGGASDAEVLQSPPTLPPEASPEPDLPDAAFAEASERSRPGTESPPPGVNGRQDGGTNVVSPMERSSPAEQPLDVNDDINEGEPHAYGTQTPHKRSAEIVIKRGRGRPPKRQAILDDVYCDTC